MSDKFLIPLSLSPSSVLTAFPFDVEFHTLKQTGGNSSEMGKNSDRQTHPRILTYSYDLCLTAGF